MLEFVVFLLFDILGLEYIFIEDGAKVHLGKVLRTQEVTSILALRLGGLIRTKKPRH